MFGDLKSRPWCNSKVPHTLGAQFSLLNLKFRTRIKRFWFIKQNRLNLDVWWFINPAPVELRGPSRLETPIPPSNHRILNTHKEIFIQNEFILFLDVWWFNNPALGRIKESPMLGNPNCSFKPLNFKYPQRNFHPKWIYTNFRCLVV
jgi:hypothetical protein